MKSAYKFEILLFGVIYLAVLMFFASCEQEEAPVNLTVAPGGGTATTYKAYTVSAETEDDVYGRIVFYKDNANHTLVQVALYNTSAETEYESTLFSGAVDVADPAVAERFYSINGATGEFAPSKFFVIADKNFFSGLSDLDAHIRIMSGETLISSGNVGKNATPVAESE